MTPITRPVEPSDLNFILNSFLKSMRAYPEFQHIPNQVYYPALKNELINALSENSSIVLCNSEDPDQIFGYVIFTPDVSTYFIYVKYPYRQLGMARRLLMRAHPNLIQHPISATFTMKNWDIVSRKFNLVHNPYRGVV